VIALGAGRTDVADAAMKGDKAALRSLIQQKTDVNAPQVDGATAVHWAVYRDDAEVLEMLIAGGARVDVANREGVTPLHMASLYGNVAIIDKLLKAGANVKQKGPAGESMLMLAARNGNPDAIKLLLSAGADVNAREPRRGTTALMWAVEQHHPAAVKALLDGGADLAMKSGGAGLPRNCRARLIQQRSKQRRDQRDKGSRDTDTVVSVNAGHTWQAVDYADGLVRVGVQSAIARPETGALIRKLMAERGMPFPPINRTVYSVCIVELCKERVPNGDLPQK